MNKIFNAPNRNVIIPAIVIVLLAVQAVSGAEAYLASIGPPPLRFEYVDDNNALFLKELELPKPAPVSEPAMPAPQAEANPETTIAASQPVAGSPADMSGVPFLPGAGKNGHHPDSSASDMLSISPQMISDYFKPYSAEGDSESGPFQHGDQIFVPAELGFVPPGSRAIYNSK
jgi:hypothetical protein